MKENKEIKEFDERNNIIHYKDSNGDEYWAEYDERNNIIHCKGNNSHEEWREYDEEYICHVTGKLRSYSYDYIMDDDNSIISFKDSLGCTYHDIKDNYIDNKIFIKGLHEDMTGYNGFQFEVGKEYKIDSDEMKLCSDKVFHFGRTLIQVLRFYNIPTDRYFEIEVLGDIVEDDDKCGSNHIKIIREIIL